MPDDLPAYTVDTRGSGPGRELLIYKLESDKWGKPYYVPSAFAPLSNSDARQLALALLLVSSPEPA